LGGRYPADYYGHSVAGDCNFNGVTPDK